MLYSCFSDELTPKIKKITGLRDDAGWCSLSPLNLLEVGCSGNHGLSCFQGSLLPLLLPVPCGAMTVIGVSTLPQVS